MKNNIIESKYKKVSHKVLRTVIAVILAFVLSVGYIPTNAFAANNKNNGVKYEETHDQITFDDLAVYVVNKTDVVVDVDPSISIFRKIEAKKQKEKYYKYIEEHPEGVEDLKNAINSSELICAISYTDAPLVYVDDHYERIKKEKTSTNMFGIKATALEEESDGTPGGNNKFTLKTIISRAGNKNPYLYTAQTVGIWDTNISLIFNKENKPAEGGDYVIQTCPITTHTAMFFSEYNYSTDGNTQGQEGVNFFQRDSGDAWIKYEVYDDPLGLAQLKNFYCIQMFDAIATDDTKKVYSQYVHTWDTMTLDVSFNFIVNPTGGKPLLVPIPTLDPEIEERQWQLNDFVSYDW